MAPFEPVDGDYQGGCKSEPQLCVWKGGGFHLTPAADRQYFADADSVGIHHDPARDGVVLGLEPDPETEGNHVRSLTRTDGDGADINALSVLKELEIDYESITEPHRFDLEPHDGEGPVVATVDIAPLGNGGVETAEGDATPEELPEPDQDAEEHLEEIEDVPPAEPGEVEDAAAEAVADLDAEGDSPDEPEGDSATQIFEDAASEDVEWSDIDTPDWLDEGSFYASLEEASDLEELRDVLGWKNKYDGKLERFVDRLGVWDELKESDDE